MFGAVLGAGGVEYVGMQTVNDEPTLFFILYQTGVTQHAEMVRDINDLDIEQCRQLTDVAFAAAQTVDDAQSLRVRQRAESASATVGL